MKLSPTASWMASASLILLLASCGSLPEPAPETTSAAPALPQLMAQAVSVPASTVVYDTVSNGGVLKEIGQNVRITNTGTAVILSARVASTTGQDIRTAGATIRVYRDGESRYYDIGYVGNYVIPAKAAAFMASSRFSSGNYTYCFAYKKDGQWIETARRSFTVTPVGKDKTTVDVPLDPVNSNEENAGPLKFVGADTRVAYANEAVRLTARLSSSTPLDIKDKDSIFFIFRGTDTKEVRNKRPWTIPAQIDSDTTFSSTAYLPAGTYGYRMTYADPKGIWHEMGDYRSLTVLATPAVPAPLSGDVAGLWKLDASKSDEFSSVDESLSKWDYGLDYFTSGPLAFDNKNVSMADGKLLLNVVKQDKIVNGKMYSYTAGAVHSKFTIPGDPSFVEVRAKVLDSRANVLSAIWLQGPNFGRDMNPNPEIDIQETFQFDTLNTTIHTWEIFSGQSDANDAVLDFQRSATGVADTSTDYHLYGLERRDGWLRFYFDRKLIWEIKPDVPAISKMERNLIFSLEGHLNNPKVTQPPLPVKDNYLSSAFMIDWVHTYNYAGR